ncbi:hypothetical protein ACFL1A_00290 [Patescibacteria group bacterium]
MPYKPLLALSLLITILLVSCGAVASLDPVPTIVSNASDGAFAADLQRTTETPMSFASATPFPTKTPKTISIGYFYQVCFPALNICDVTKQDPLSGAHTSIITDNKVSIDGAEIYLLLVTSQMQVGNKYIACPLPNFAELRSTDGIEKDCIKGVYHGLKNKGAYNYFHLQCFYDSGDSYNKFLSTSTVGVFEYIYDLVEE